MADPRVEKLAQILVDHSAEIKPGDRVAIEATTAAAPLVRALYATILERGGHPHPLLELPDQDEILFAHASDEGLDFVPTFRKLAYDQFESRMRIHSETNPRGLSNVDPARQKRHQKALAPILEAQMRRGADRSFKWVTTLFPTEGLAMEAEMSLTDYEDFVYRACHADQPDPLAFWHQVEVDQRKIVDRLDGHDQVVLRGPNVDLTLSIKGRTFINACGRSNMPDGSNDRPKKRLTSPGYHWLRSRDMVRRLREFRVAKSAQDVGPGSPDTGSCPYSSDTHAQKWSRTPRADTGREPYHAHLHDRTRQGGPVRPGERRPCGPRGIIGPRGICGRRKKTRTRGLQGRRPRHQPGLLPGVPLLLLHLE